MASVGFSFLGSTGNQSVGSEQQIVPFSFSFAMPLAVKKSEEPLNFDFEKSTLIFNVHSLTQVLGFDPMKNWSSLRVEQLCIISAVKVFSTYFSHPLPAGTSSQVKDKFFKQFFWIMQQEVWKEKPVVLEQFFKQMRETFALSAHFTAEYAPICTLLKMIMSQDLKNVDLRKAKLKDLSEEASSYEDIVAGVRSLCEIQEDCIALVLPDVKQFDDKIKETQRKVADYEKQVEALHSLTKAKAQRELRKDVARQLGGSSTSVNDVTATALELSKAICNSLPRMVEALRRLTRYQALLFSTVESRKLIRDSSASEHETAYFIMQDRQKAKGFARAALAIKEDVKRTVEEVANPLIHDLGFYTSDETLTKLYKCRMATEENIRLTFLRCVTDFFCETVDFGPYLGLVQFQEINLEQLILFIKTSAIEITIEKRMDVSVEQITRKMKKLGIDLQIPEPLLTKILAILKSAHTEAVKEAEVFQRKYLVKKDVFYTQSLFDRLFNMMLMLERDFKVKPISNLAKLQGALSQTLEIIGKLSYSDERLQIQRLASSKKVESPTFKSIREILEPTSVITDTFSKFSYFYSEFFQEFFCSLTIGLEEAHWTSVMEEWDFGSEESSLAKLARQKSKTLPLSIEAKQVSGEEGNETPPNEPKSVDLAEKKASTLSKAGEAELEESRQEKIPPFAQFFQEFTGVSYFRLHETSFTDQEILSLQKVYHFLLLNLSRQLLEELATLEAKEEKKYVQEPELLLSSAVHAMHMVNEQALAQLYFHKKKALTRSHDLVYLTRVTLGAESLAAFPQSRLDNFQARYPHTWLTKEKTQSPATVVTQSLSGNVSAGEVRDFVNSAFASKVMGLQGAIQKELGRSSPLLDALSFEPGDVAKGMENGRSFRKSLGSSIGLINPLVQKLEASLLGDPESEMNLAVRDCIVHLKRIQSSLEFMKLHPEQRYYVLHVHNVIASVQHALELLCYAHSLKMGMPAKEHNLKIYITLCNWEESAVLTKRDLQIIEAFNTKKGIDYPLASKLLHNAACKHTQTLWESFSISAQAFCEGEGFLSKSKAGNYVGQKYSQLAEGANEAVLVLGKLVDLLLKQEEAAPNQGSASPSKDDKQN
ncbi:MAG: hypothetical protein HKM07_05590 [Chlamydiae bacterium]|nr:hypothetical protein [Chlamydiota bacterium]